MVKNNLKQYDKRLYLFKNIFLNLNWNTIEASKINTWKISIKEYSLGIFSTLLDINTKIKRKVVNKKLLLIL